MLICMLAVKTTDENSLGCGCLYLVTSLSYCFVARHMFGFCFRAYLAVGLSGPCRGASWQLRARPRAGATGVVVNSGFSSLFFTPEKSHQDFGHLDCDSSRLKFQMGATIVGALCFFALGNGAIWIFCAEEFAQWCGQSQLAQEASGELGGSKVFARVTGCSKPVRRKSFDFELRSWSRSETQSVPQPDPV